MKKIIAFLLFFYLFLACENAQVKKKEQEVEVESTLVHDSIPIQKILSQQLLVKLNAKAANNMDSVKFQLEKMQPGGIFFEDWEVSKVEEVCLFADSVFTIKPFFMGDYFKLIDLPEFQIWSNSKGFRNYQYWQGFRQSGLNWLMFKEKFLYDYNTEQYLKASYQDSMVNPIIHLNIDSLNAKQLRKKLFLFQHSEFPIFIDVDHLDSLPYQQIRSAFGFKGMFLVNTKRHHTKHLRAGADLVLVHDFKDLDLEKMKSYPSTIPAVENLMKLKQKFYAKVGFRGFEANLKANKYHIQAKSTALLKDENKLLPFKRLLYIQVDELLKPKKSIGKGPFICKIPNNASDSLLKSFSKNPTLKRVMLVFSNPNHLKILKNCPNLCFTPFAINRILEAQFLGGLPIDGNFSNRKVRLKGVNRKSQQLTTIPPEYAFVNPFYFHKISGIIREAMNGRAFPGCQVLAIRNGGIIFQKSYGKTAYANGENVRDLHVYDLASLTKVLATTLVGMKLWEEGYYTLEDKIGKYLPDTLKNYLPNGSTLRNITFKELFIHQSGLPAGFPVLPYMKKAADKEERFYNGFCDYPYEGFETQVAKDLYMDATFQDSMWIKLNSLWLDTTKAYKYSDVNMNLLYFLFKRIIDTNRALTPKKKYRNRNTYEAYLHQTFYEPLGMHKTGFNPLNYTVLHKIVPTENERYWRKQLLQGYVHDPNAALYGGVAGNAGLFSNVKDLAILLNMWQNGGIHNGKRYLKSATIQTFIQTQNGSHRGLGFNKRTLTNAAYGMADSAHQNTYGHTGFTGTCFWIDPVENLTFIFLSNRVHPKINNKIYQYKVRKRIHEVFYQALLN